MSDIWFVRSMFNLEAIGVMLERRQSNFISRFRCSVSFSDAILRLTALYFRHNKAAISCVVWNFRVWFKSSREVTHPRSRRTRKVWRIPHCTRRRRLRSAVARRTNERSAAAWTTTERARPRRTGESLLGKPTENSWTDSRGSQSPLQSIFRSALDSASASVAASRVGTASACDCGARRAKFRCVSRSRTLSWTSPLHRHAVTVTVPSYQWNVQAWLKISGGRRMGQVWRSGGPPGKQGTPENAGQKNDGRILTLPCPWTVQSV